MSAEEEKGDGNVVEIIQKLLGSSIICTLADGRTAEGRLVCVDRLYVQYVMRV